MKLATCICFSESSGSSFFEFNFLRYHDDQIISLLNIRTTNSGNNEIFGRETCLNRGILFPFREIYIESGRYSVDTGLESIFCQGVTLRFQIAHIMNFISNESSWRREFNETKW